MISLVLLSILISAYLIFSITLFVVILTDNGKDSDWAKIICISIIALIISPIITPLLLGLFIGNFICKEVGK